MTKEQIEQAIGDMDDRYIDEAMTFTQKRNTAAYKWFRGIKAAAACVGIVFLLSVSTLSAATAAGSIPAFDILYSLNPQVALKLSPVKVSCEDQGIKMTVESIYVQEDTAQVYISMQDLTGDRIDGTIDLFDSYALRTGKDQVGTCSLVDYDKDKKLATFLVSVQNMNGQKIKAGRLSFMVSRFLSGKEEWNRELTQITPGQIREAENIQTDVDFRGASAEDESGYNPSGYLTVDEAKRFSPVEGVTVTSYGFIDGKLHIQVYYDDILHTDNHGFVWLQDQDGTVIDCVKSIAFWDEEGVGSYEEYLFDLGMGDMHEGLTVWGYFVTSSTLTEGNWEVTFPIETLDNE